MWSPNRSLHIVIGIPSTGRLSLIAIGTPANGRGSLGPIVAAVASAESCATCVNALMVGSSASIRSSDSETSSVALSSPERTSPASSPIGRNISSDTGRTLLPASLSCAHKPQKPLAPRSK